MPVITMYTRTGHNAIIRDGNNHMYATEHNEFSLIAGLGHLVVAELWICVVQLAIHLLEEHELLHEACASVFWHAHHMSLSGVH